MPSRLKILVLTPEPPYPPAYGGARLRLFNVLARLSATHEFTLLTLVESPEEKKFIPELEKLCHRLLTFDRKSFLARPTLKERLQAPAYKCYYSTDIAAAITRELTEQQFDLVHVDTPHMAVYTPQLRRSRKIMAATDSATLGLRSWLGSIHHPLKKLRACYTAFIMEQFERRLYREYNACVVIADRDRDAVRELCPKLPIHIIPNGVDLEYFRPQDTTPEEPARLIFTGTMDYEPNVDAVQWFVNRMLPEIRKRDPRVCFDIVGRAPTKDVLALASHPGVSVTGAVPDMRPYLAKAAIYICPLRLGSGMKNKLLEAMAMGKAIVTTAEGASGNGGRSGSEYVIADEEGAIIAAIVGLLQNPEKRRQMGQAARAYVEQQYSWDRTAREFQELYQAVARA